MHDDTISSSFVVSSQLWSSVSDDVAVGFAANREVSISSRQVNDRDTIMFIHVDVGIVITKGAGSFHSFMEPFFLCSGWIRSVGGLNE